MNEIRRSPELQTVQISCPQRQNCHDRVARCFLTIYNTLLTIKKIKECMKQKWRMIYVKFTCHVNFHLTFWARCCTGGLDTTNQCQFNKTVSRQSPTQRITKGFTIDDLNHGLFVTSDRIWWLIWQVIDVSSIQNIDHADSSSNGLNSVRYTVTRKSVQCELNWPSVTLTDVYFVMHSCYVLCITGNWLHIGCCTVAEAACMEKVSLIQQRKLRFSPCRHWNEASCMPQNCWTCCGRWLCVTCK